MLFYLFVYFFFGGMEFGSDFYLVREKMEVEMSVVSWFKFFNWFVIIVEVFKIIFEGVSGKLSECGVFQKVFKEENLEFRRIWQKLVLRLYVFNKIVINFYDVCL